MKRKSKKQLITSIVLLAVLVIGIGYAYLTSNLSISGQTEVVANTWNIHFENLNVKDGSVTASTPATIQSNNVDITYAITLNRPKEYYEFTVDVKNDGTLPGKVSVSSLSGLDTTSSKVIDYTITYINGNPVNIGDILNAGAKKKIKVRVYYKDDISASDFPATDLNLTLTYTLQYVQSDEDALTADNIVQELKNNSSDCFTKYEGQVTDEVGVTKTNAENVYFNKCADKRNVKFGGYCWQMIRTTETGGIKMIYNGEPDNSGRCISSRSNHKGVNQFNYTYQDLNTNYLYGSSFTYDITNNTFTLADTVSLTWSDTTYEDLLGKYTCKNTTGICTTIYNLNGYIDNNKAFTSWHKIEDTNYAQIGKSAFNVNNKSPAMVGYMFDEVYNYNSINPGTTEYKYGSDFTYDTNTNTYTLSGTTQNISDWSNGYNTINNTHYTCWNTTGICNTISYIFYTSSAFGAYYVDMAGGKSISDALEGMLTSDVVNKYNSSIKGIIDSWYAQNLTNYSDMLEDTVYCNNRNITNYGGWIPNGGDTVSDYGIQFNNFNQSTSLACQNVTDQFSLYNNKAKLAYPVSLMSHPEYYNLGMTTEADNLRKTGAWYWGLSPYDFRSSSFMNIVFSAGDFYTYSSGYAYGVRPAVSLKGGTTISDGDGSETNPWVVD